MSVYKNSNMNWKLNLGLVLALVLVVVMTLALMDTKPKERETDWHRAVDLGSAYENGFADGWHSVVAHYPLATNRIEISPLLEDMMSGESNFVYKATANERPH